MLSAEEVARILAAAPGPGLSYRAAFSVACGGELRSRFANGLSTFKGIAGTCIIDSNETIADWTKRGRRRGSHRSTQLSRLAFDFHQWTGGRHCGPD